MAPKKKTAPSATNSKSKQKLEPQTKKTKKSNDDVSEKKKSDAIINQKELFSLDVLMVIGSFAETIDIVRSMSLVCRDWNQAVLNDGLFDEVYKRDFGDPEWFVEKINYNLSVDLHAPFAIKAKKGKEESDDEEEEGDDEFDRHDLKMFKERPVPKTSADKLTLSEIKEILESAFGKGKFWYSLYRLVIAFIPIQCPKLITENEIVLPLKKGTKPTKKNMKKNTKKKALLEEDLLKKDVIHRVLSEEDDEDDDGGFEEKPISSNYFYFALGLKEIIETLENVALASRLIPALAYDLSTYKLGLILSLFDRHGLILEYFGKNQSHEECLNKITNEYKDHQKKILAYDFSEDTRSDVGALPRTPYIETLKSFLIGYDTADNHSCSILQFCYAMLCGNETKLFKGTRRKPKKLTTFADDYDLNNTVGVGPHTEDEFMPYCSYEIIEQPRFDEYSYGVSSVVIDVDPTSRTCSFVSSFPGYVRGFWNANFYWYHVVEFDTKIEDFNGSDMLTIAQNQNQILHNLC